MNKRQLKNHKSKSKQTYKTNAKQYHHVKFVKESIKITNQKFAENKVKFNELTIHPSTVFSKNCS